MPLNLPDFLRAPIQRSEYIPMDKGNPYAGLENLIPNTMASYQAPIKMKQDRESAERKKKAEELAQKFMETYGPREREADIAMKENMAANYARLASGLGGTGSGLGTGDGRSSRSGITPSSRVWNSLPSNIKSDLIATGVGLGYTPDEIAIALSSGKTMKDLADSAEKDLSEVEKQYAPTTSNVTKLKNQEGSAAELDFLEQKTNSAMSQYSRKFFGYSPTQIAQALSGENADEQAKYLAARALQPEIAGARSNIAGGSNSQQALHDAQTAALGSSKIFEGLVSPEVNSLTQHYINEWLKEGFKIRKSVIQNDSNKNKKKESSEYNPFDASQISIDDLIKMRGRE